MKRDISGLWWTNCSGKVDSAARISSRGDYFYVNTALQSFVIHRTAVLTSKVCA